MLGLETGRWKEWRRENLIVTKRDFIKKKDLRIVKKGKPAIKKEETF